MSVWEVQQMRVVYGSGVVALDDVSFRVKAGERVGLVGSSGSGKTTLARAGLGLVPSVGRISLFGEDTAAWRPRQWLAARQRAQLLFQDPRAMLHPAIPIGVLLAESAALHRPRESVDAAVTEVLTAVGLSDRVHAWPHELSGGERRRAGLARVLLARPALLVADEPTVGLDASLKADLLQLMLNTADPECAVVLVSHDLHAISWATDRIVVMDAGRVVDSFPTKSLVSSEPRHPITEALMAAAGVSRAPKEA